MKRKERVAHFLHFLLRTYYIVDKARLFESNYYLRFMCFNKPKKKEIKCWKPHWVDDLPFKRRKEKQTMCMVRERIQNKWTKTTESFNGFEQVSTSNRCTLPF